MQVNSNNYQTLSNQFKQKAHAFEQVHPTAVKVTKAALIALGSMLLSFSSPISFVAGALAGTLTGNTHEGLRTKIVKFIKGEPLPSGLTSSEKKVAAVAGCLAVFNPLSAGAYFLGAYLGAKFGS